MANSAVNLLTLDPDTAKASLIQYMQTQSLLKSYAFDGAVMNELISLLATNDFKLSFYYNMINAESWLDSGQLRSSVVSHAKELNYLPRSARSSSVTVNVAIPTDGIISVITIPKGTTFSGRVGTDSFNFVTDQTSVYTSSNGLFNVSGLVLYEGNYLADTYIMDYTQETQEFLITNKNVDTDSITVTVTEDGGASIYEYNFSTSLLGVSPTSLSYFLQCNETEQYQILFGDDLFGRKPKNGATITILYRVTLGELANGVQALAMNRDVTGGHLAGTPTVAVPLPSAGGASIEDIESIRFMAPRHYEAQERAVGEADYEILLMGQFPEIRAVAVFGGETLSPPRYGSVLVSVDISNINGLPQSKQDQYTAYLKPRSMMRLMFTTPETLYYQIVSTVNYDINQTTLTPNDLETLVMAAVANYNQSYLNNFKVSLRYSRLCNVIDNSHASIISNETDVYVYKKIIPTLGVNLNMTVDLVVPIYNNLPQIPTSHPLSEDIGVWSSPFYYNGVLVRIEDDSLGNLWLMKYKTVESTIVKVGTVNYSTGLLTLNGLSVDSYQGDSLQFFARPAQKDIAVVGNNILTVEIDKINLNIVQVHGV